MPVHIAAQVLSDYLPSGALTNAAAAVLGVTLAKTWSNGTDWLSPLDEGRGGPGEKDLHGRVVVIVGGFTPLGLVVQAQLASRGAQIVALVPALNDPEVQDLTNLLRESTNNELIYAEECDVLNPRSVVEFARTWYRGMKQGNKSNPLAGGAASGAAAPGANAGGGVSAAPTADAFASAAGETSAIRLDAILFLPLDATAYSVGEGIQRVGAFTTSVEPTTRGSVPAPQSTSSSSKKSRKKGTKSQPQPTPETPEKPFEGLELAHSEVAARYHFIKSMLPSIRLLPPDRDIRIVSIVSPWASTGVATFSATDPDWTGATPTTHEPSFPSWQPWCATGAAALRWLVLSATLQQQIDLLQLRDGRGAPAPPTEEGTDEIDLLHSTPSSNVRLVNVSLGFERNHDMLRLILPPPKPEGPLRWETEQEGTEGNESISTTEAKPVSPEPKSSKPNPPTTESKAEAPSEPQTKTPEALTEELKRSVDPRRKHAGSPFVGVGVTAGPASYTRGTCAPFEALVRYILSMLLWPLLWLTTKSPGRAGDGATWALTAPLQSAFVPAASDATNKSHKAKYARVRPVVLFREAEPRAQPLPPGAQTHDERKFLAQREDALIERWLKAANDAAAASIKPVSEDSQPTNAAEK